MLSSRLLVLLPLLIAAWGHPLHMTLRHQHMSTTGRQEWQPTYHPVAWESERTAFVVVDMWDQHWCPSATTRVSELATPMNQFLKQARRLGALIVWAPSDVTSFYNTSTARLKTLSLPHSHLPVIRNVTVPTMPLGTDTDGGCDVNHTIGSPWRRQIASLEIHDQDYLIAADLPRAPMAGRQELWNLVRHRHLEQIIYLGVHENMCILGRPFAIEAMTSLGFKRHQLGVVRELVDVMYTPKDPPYVSHHDGLNLHTSYVEKFWAGSVSMYDLLTTSAAYNTSRAEF